jgi:uncharacterized protein (DUF1330 family)
MRDLPVRRCAERPDTIPFPRLPLMADRVLGGQIMKKRFAVSLAILGGFGLGAIAVQSLHAQSKPPAYYVVELEVLNADGYAKEYAPLATKVILDSGGTVLARGGKTISFEGAPVKGRIVVVSFDNMDKVIAWRSSAAYKEITPLREKYSKIVRAFAVEGPAK